MNGTLKTNKYLYIKKQNTIVDEIQIVAINILLNLKEFGNVKKNIYKHKIPIEIFNISLIANICCIDVMLEDILIIKNKIQIIINRYKLPNLEIRIWPLQNC